MDPLPAQNSDPRSRAFPFARAQDKAARAAGHAFRTLAVLASVALALRAGDAVPGWISDLPRGVHLCASLDEAEVRTGLHLGKLHQGLPGHALMAGGIRTAARPFPAIAMALQGGDGKSQLTLFRSRGGEIPATLRTPLPSFHEITIPLRPGLSASLKAERRADSSVWQDLEWSEGTIITALRFNGRTVDLLGLARQLAQDGKDGP
jgi:hypothetical protein